MVIEGTIIASSTPYRVTPPGASLRMGGKVRRRGASVAGRQPRPAQPRVTDLRAGEGVRTALRRLSAAQARAQEMQAWAAAEERRRPWHGAHAGGAGRPSCDIRLGA